MISVAGGTALEAQQDAQRAQQQTGRDDRDEHDRDTAASKQIVSADERVVCWFDLELWSCKDAAAGRAGWRARLVRLHAGHAIVRMQWLGSLRGEQG